jgi:hypothetical protein
MPNLKTAIKPTGHFIKDRKTEILLGFVVTIIGLLLLWDAFDGRNKKMPWPLGGLAPW